MAKVFADDISLCPADEPHIAYRRFAIIDSIGNYNRKLDRGETGDCILTLRCQAGAVGNLTGILRSNSPDLEVLQPNANFGSLNAGDSAMNRTSRFLLRASLGAPIEYPIWCDLLLSGDGGFVETLSVPLMVGDSMTEPLGPDDYGYLAYDNGDVTYDQCPTYEWAEIRSIGNRVTLGDDDVRVIDLPPEFGPLYYYGQRTTKLSICSNGWVAPDTSTCPIFNNIHLPDRSAPRNMIAVLWDNFDPTAFGWIGWYHDATNHRLIVEFDSLPYFPLHDRWEKFQIVFYDTTLAGPTGDNVFVLQYASASNIGSVSVGCQNRAGNSGLNYLWNTFYPRQAAPIVPGRAIRFEAVPMMGTREELRNADCGMRNLHLTCTPNPVQTAARISYELPAAGRAEIAIYDASGRLVRKLGSSQMPAGRHVLTWNASAAVPGVYFCDVTNAGHRSTLKITHR